MLPRPRTRICELLRSFMVPPFSPGHLMPDEEPTAAVVAAPVYSTGDGIGWQPNSTAGGSCLFSLSRSAVVVHGGIAPGLGRSADVCVGELARQSGGQCALRWEKLRPNQSIPRRCFHGAAMLQDASRGDSLLVFGGEGEPKKPGVDAALAGPTLLNDLWAVNLHSSRATNLIATSGAPPTPRSHHAMVALKDPASPAAKPRASKLRKSALSMLMQARVSEGAAAAGKQSAAGPSSVAGSDAGRDRRRQQRGTGSGSAEQQQTQRSQGCHGWTVLSIGGVLCARAPACAHVAPGMCMRRLVHAWRLRVCACVPGACVCVHAVYASMSMWRSRPRVFCCCHVRLCCAPVCCAPVCCVPVCCVPVCCVPVCRPQVARVSPRASWVPPTRFACCDSARKAT